MNGAAIGAIIGLVVGLALSGYVAWIDWRKRQDGIRTRAQYRLSLFAVPIVFALLGSFVGGAIAQL